MNPGYATEPLSSNGFTFARGDHRCSTSGLTVTLANQMLVDEYASGLRTPEDWRVTAKTEQAWLASRKITDSLFLAHPEVSAMAAGVAGSIPRRRKPSGEGSAT